MNRDETGLQAIVIYIPMKNHLHLPLKRIARNIVTAK